ncbi:MAG: GIY-YIG nuclease family protein [Bradyrhizobium sp.]
MVSVVNKQYVYVLRSACDGRFYVGLTSDVVGRLQQHNDGKVPSTKARDPFELIYWEGCLKRKGRSSARVVSQECTDGRKRD